MGETEWEIVQKVILVVIEVAVPILLTWGLAELKKYVDQLKQNDQWDVISGIVKTAVEAAEQLGLSDQLEEFADSKLNAAIALIETQLEARGILLDLDEYAEVIRAMIEAEVAKLNLS